MGEITKYLADWLVQNVHNPQELGVVDPKVGNAISETLKIKCRSTELILEIIRGIRTHFVSYLRGVESSDLHQAQLGLCHSYSRSKVKFNVHKLDAMIIHSISLLEMLDKDVNTVSMRAREWYGMHFPELGKIATESFMYSQIANILGDRSTVRTNPNLLEQLTEVTQSQELAQRVIDSAKISMGTVLSDHDWIMVKGFLTRVVSLHAYREQLYNYLINKMQVCAPNMSALIGETLGAKLIAKAGSLTNLAKAAASTVQLLGAEKSLFRSLKNKSNTPKYGVIYNSSFIGKANAKDKARMARIIANKTSIAARIDCFTDDLSMTNIYGEEMKKQIEERLLFYKSGAPPRKNSIAMATAKKAFSAFEDEFYADKDEKPTTSPSKKSKKNDTKMKDGSDEELVQLPKAEKLAPLPVKQEEEPKKEKKDKKDKKDKKRSRMEDA